MAVLKSNSADDTKKIGVVVAKKIITQPLHTHARVLFLVGELGAGKTTFIQGFIRALGIQQRITSPTFLIMKRYTSKKLPYKNLYHLDAYRVAHIKELAPLGIDAILANPKNLILIEWANNLKGAHIIKPTLLTFRHGRKENERSISVRNL